MPKACNGSEPIKCSSVYILEVEDDCHTLQTRRAASPPYLEKVVKDQMADGTLVSLLCHPCVTLASP